MYCHSWLGTPDCSETLASCSFTAFIDSIMDWSTAELIFLRNTHVLYVSACPVQVGAASLLACDTGNVTFANLEKLLLNSMNLGVSTQTPQEACAVQRKIVHCVLCLSPGYSWPLSVWPELKRWRSRRCWTDLGMLRQGHRRGEWHISYRLQTTLFLAPNPPKHKLQREQGRTYPSE
jgi:hypothetical protein